MWAAVLVSPTPRSQAKALTRLGSPLQPELGHGQLEDALGHRVAEVAEDLAEDDCVDVAEEELVGQLVDLGAQFPQLVDRPGLGDTL